MGAKLGLTLYMGRFLSLDAVGLYGLVSSAVVLLSVLLGQGFNYVVVRDIVGLDPLTASHKIRDMALIYAANYIVLALLVAGVIATGLSRMSPEILWFVVALTALEGYGTASYHCMQSLQQQLLANAIFCVRSGLWVFPVIAVGILVPEYRRIEVVLGGWCLGAALSFLATLYAWRGLPWRQAMLRPVDWAWMWAGLKKSSLIWFGATGLAAGLYLDRFVVERFLTLSDVGVITFYSSFTNALFVFAQSSVLAFATPRLIQYHRERAETSFGNEARRAMKQVALIVCVGAFFLGVVVPLLGLYTRSPALVDQVSVLWLMLFGTWLRAVAEVLYAMLYSRHQDRPIWLGNALFLIPAIGGNAILIPAVGIKGAGLSTILGATFLVVWRWRYVGNVVWDARRRQSYNPRAKGPPRGQGRLQAGDLER